MKKIIIIGLIIFSGIVIFSTARGGHFYELRESPNWEALKEKTVFSNNQKKGLNDFISNKTEFDAVTILQNGQLIYSDGDIELPMNLASGRKSVFSLLYGIAAEKGLVDIDKTLKELGVDDEKNPLSEIEKSATLRDLLQARSGIYLPALGESENMKKRRPERGSHKPGEYFYYNNWDFNALPIILEKVTGKKIGELIYEWLAIPTGMRYFSPGNVTYQYMEYTDFPMTRVYMTSEDLARLGQLVLNNGKWNGKQIVPEKWIIESTTPVSIYKNDEQIRKNKDFLNAYSYLWWNDLDNKTVWAVGSGGQYLIIDRENSLVICCRNNTGTSSFGYFWYVLTGKKYADYNMAKGVYKRVIELINE